VRASPRSSPRTLSRLADAAAKFLGGFTRVRTAAGALSREKETSDFDGWLRRVCVLKHEGGLSIRHAQDTAREHTERREGAQSPCPSPMTPSLSVYVSSAVSAAYISDADTGTDPNDTGADGHSLVFAYPSSL
jgi:hypothetical protein